jgi:predicted DNA-binding transcriptional regulator YafY
MMPSRETYFCEIAARKRDRRSAIIDTMQSTMLTKAHELAALFNTTIRTIYRDIAELKQLGYKISGEAGVGYMLRGTKQ